MKLTPMFFASSTNQVVQRHVDIETFRPEPYWVLELGILKRGRRLRALWESGRSFNKNKTENLVKKALEDNAVAVVKNVVIKDKKQGRPVRKFWSTKEKKSNLKSLSISSPLTNCFLSCYSFSLEYRFVA